MPMCEEIAQFQIYHPDLHFGNFVYTDESYSNQPAPYSGRTFRWRIIDFDNAEFTDDKPDRVVSAFGDGAEELLDDCSHYRPWRRDRSC